MRKCLQLTENKQAKISLSGARSAQRLKNEKPGAGTSSVSRVKVSAKADAFPSRASALRLKRELLEAVAGRNPRLNRELMKQSASFIPKCQ